MFVSLSIFIFIFIIFLNGMPRVGTIPKNLYYLYRYNVIFWKY